MKIQSQTFLIVLMFASIVNAQAKDAPSELPLNEHLQAFQPLIGKTFRGDLTEPNSDKKTIDVSKWERAMNGNAIRNLHSINDGEYGGESIFIWDIKQQKILYWYFTTAGFYTQGTMEIDGPTWSSIEQVTGNKNGITKVKSKSTVLQNGDLQVQSEYFVNDKWTPGHNVLYQPAPGAQVKFK